MNNLVETFAFLRLFHEQQNQIFSLPPSHSPLVSFTNNQPQKETIHNNETGTGMHEDAVIWNYSILRKLQNVRVPEMQISNMRNPDIVMSLMISPNDIMGLFHI